MDTVNPSTLYICATPIGHIGDVSERLVGVLKAVDYILCEDTRVTGILLSRIGISNRTLAFNHHQERHRFERVLDDLKAGQSVALVSDAGTPGICDPGFWIVQTARAAGVQVVPVPGPSAVSAFLSVLGADISGYWFVGFLPKRPEGIRDLVKTAITHQIPIVFFESPHRLRNTLDWLATHHADTTLMLAKELTKIHERFFSGTPKVLLDRSDEMMVDRGEWIGCLVPPPADLSGNLRSWVQEMNALGLNRRQIIALGTQYFGFKKNSLYQVVTALLEDK